MGPAAQAHSLKQDRIVYRKALAALKTGHIRTFRKLYKAERGYIARPYLEYAYLRDRLRHDTPAQIARFLKQAAALPVAASLRDRWLHYLALHHRNRTFLAFYQPGLNNDVDLHCDDLVARHSVGQDITASAGRIWLTGATLPKVCRPVVQVWQRAGGQTATVTWARVKLAMRAGNETLVARLVGHLRAAQAVWARRWLALQAHPHYALLHVNYSLGTPRARHMVRAAVIGLGYQNALTAMALWHQLCRRHPALDTDNDHIVVLQGLGLLGAQEHLPQAVGWLAQTVGHHDTAQVRRWRVRAALRQREWSQVLFFINAMPRSQQQHIEWQYWRARALAHTGHPRRAHALFVQLAHHSNYYGFLAADRLGIPYSLPNIPVTESAAVLRGIAAQPGIQLAHQLFLLHQHRYALPQWWIAVRGFDQQQLEAASVLAAQWGWHDCAIFTIAGTQAVHALAIRFPLAYRRLIQVDARTNRIDPAWVYGIIRQESAFMMHARSYSGALGLMQLMPQTGFLAAREIHLSVTGDRGLLDVNNNVRIGTRYLADVLSNARGQEPVATASYNAGPTAVAQWLPVKHPLAADIWIDTIPYRQTRGYVKDVLAFTAIYDYRLYGCTEALRTRMQSITPVEEIAANGG